MNLLRGDVARLKRCTSIITGISHRTVFFDSRGFCIHSLVGEGGYMPRCKPLKYCYEKEIVMYAYFKKVCGAKTLIAVTFNRDVCSWTISRPNASTLLLLIVDLRGITLR